MIAETAGAGVSPIGVMQLCDTLEPGGMERMALSIANALPRMRYRVHLCTTRREGSLAGLVSADVARLRLNRRGRFDPGALRRLIRYIRQNGIQVLHAHGTSLFLAVTASFFPPHPRVIWHDHFGRYTTEQRPVWLYRLAAARVSCVIAVTEPLAEWCRRRLRVPASRVWYVPNFVTDEYSALEEQSPVLPGEPGSRIVCVANLRPEKDHRNLIQAMKEVVRQTPHAHLLLLGHANDASCLKSIEEEIAANGLASCISWLGSRNDVAAVLKGCDIGVLSSASEGLPLALIEYGMAGLPAVATRVGQCAEVLDEGRAGLLVRPGSPEELAQSLLTLLRSPALRQSLGAAFRERVLTVFAMEPNIRRISAVYDEVLHRNARGTHQIRR